MSKQQEELKFEILLQLYTILNSTEYSQELKDMLVEEYERVYKEQLL